MAIILVVEKSCFRRLALKRVLEEEGHSVCEAAGHNSALDAISDSQPDCIVDGIGEVGLMQTLRVRELKIPYVMVCEGYSESTKQMARQVGANAIINQASDKSEIKKALAEIL